jgi:hypothetical protein
LQPAAVQRFGFSFAVSLVAGALIASEEQSLLPKFQDVTSEARITFVNHASHTARKYLPETMVGGVAMLDFDNDGRLDLFFVNGAELKDPMSAESTPDKSDPSYWNRLYRNNGNGMFTDVTEKAGVRGGGFGMGVAVADYDNDGFSDLYVTALGGNTLYHNNGNGTFTDVSASAGVRGQGWSSSAAFVDYDRDGLLDLFVSRYLDWDFSKDIFCGQPGPGRRAYCHPDQFEPVRHLLFHNDGHGRFRDVSDESGISRSAGKGLGVAIQDYDGDGWPDILVANDAVAQQLFHNLKNGKFEEVGLRAGLAYDADGNAFSGMGLDWADFENSGRAGVFIDALAKQKYALFRNTDGGAFDYISGGAGIAAASFSHSGWGAKFVDYDGDGRKDLFIVQGHVMDNIQTSQPDVRYLEPPMLLRNGGKTFVNVSTVSGSIFSHSMAARGAAFGYLGNNGKVDVAVNCNNEPAVLLEATTPANHWLLIDTVGTRSNRDGIGASVRITLPDKTQQSGFVSSAGSYMSSSDKRVHFGLGQNGNVTEVEIKWPSGIDQKLSKVPADQVVVVREPAQ